MGRRFIDTELWKKPWFWRLGPLEKLGFLYMITNCDNVGIWQPDEKMVEVMIGAKVNWSQIVEATHGDLEMVGDDKIWLRDFCRFQYKNIEGDNNASKSYRELAQKHGILEKIRATYIPVDNGHFLPMVSPSSGPHQALVRVPYKDKEQDKDSSLGSSGVREDSSGDVGEEGVEPSSPASSGLDRGWMKEVVGRLNEKAGTAFKADTDQTVRFLKARAAEGFVVEDFLLVIDFKVGQWRSDPEMAQYLRPSTLFSPKFEGYLQAARNAVVEEEHAQQKREEQRRPTGNQAAPRSW